MNQERTEQNQQHLLTGAEKSQARLQQTLSRVSSTKENKTSRMVQMRRLANLYSRLANPRIDLLESVSSSLVNSSIENLYNIQRVSYQAIEQPEHFFAQFGVSIKHPEKTRDGANNFVILVTEVKDKLDLLTGQVRYGEDLNTKTIVEDAYELVQRNAKEEKLRNAIRKVKDEPDLKKRYRLGLRLKRQILNYIGSFSFTFKRDFEDDSFEPTWKNLTVFPSWLPTFYRKNGGSISGNFGIRDGVEIATAAITRYTLEKKICKLPSKDQRRFKELRHQYGAKAANLIILSELLESINKLKRPYFFSDSLAIPDFRAVPVDSFRAWKEGKLLDTTLQPYFDWASNLENEDNRYEGKQHSDYIIRSSAVFSEDGENVTGAGIYESVKIEEGTTFEEFKNAVIKVYESTYNPRAIEYRLEHCIDREEMGLVIQRYITPDAFSSYRGSDSEKGYVNSRLTGIPELMEIVTGMSRNFIKRTSLDFYLALEPNRDRDALLNIHHFAPDQFKVRPDVLERVAQFTSIIERIWGKDIQAEFVRYGCDINFVQVRELSKNVLMEGTIVRFPDEKPTYTGAAIGIGDMKLPVLDDREDNSKQTGVVVFPTNEQFSMGDNSYHLPKKGAVIITNDTGKNGHIQTLCGEKGLICVFPDANSRVDLPFYIRLNRFKSLRIVANGLEGRVYVINENQV